MTIRFGWNNDLVMVFGFKYGPSGLVESTWKHGRPIRDGKDIVLRIEESTNNVLVTFGRNGDLHARLCFDVNNNKWLRNRNYRVNYFPPCDMDVTTEKVMRNH